MSLRLRLAFFFAVIAAATAALMGLISYAVTADRLQREADAALSQAAAPYLADLRDGPAADDGRRPGGHDRPNDGRGIGATPVQGLLPDGTIVPLALTSVQLPVDSTDVELAAATTIEQRFRTDEYDGIPIRMLTESSGQGDGAIQAARNWSESQAVLRSLAATLSLIGLGVAILAAALGWLLARRLTESLADLTVAAETVGATGRLDVAVPGTGTDEVGRLAGSFNLMLARLAAARQEQQRLVQDAGHELRTPLTSLRTNIDLLRHFEELPAADRSRVLADLAGETRELSTLVNEIIDLGVDLPLNPDPVPVELATVARSAVERARRRTGRDVSLQADDSVVMGSGPALERALWNLIENAVKFAPEGPIVVTVTAGTVSVADHGPGIADADLPQVFDRFFRSTQARSQPGSGLGLSIVSEVARTHGGTVFAHNGEATAGPSQGAVVGMQLPLVQR